MIKPLNVSISIEQILVQEQAKLTNLQTSKLLIGVPKELDLQEKRIALTPETVSILTTKGHRVIVEKGAGLAARYADELYQLAGAIITDDRELVWQSSIVVKVSLPSVEEVMMMQSHALLFSMLPFLSSSKKVLIAMQQKCISGVSYHLMEDEFGGLSLLEQQCDIEGRTAVMLASNYLMDIGGGKGILIGGCGGVSPTEVLVIGADRAGGEVARTAQALGARITVFDYRVAYLRRLQSELGKDIFTSTFHPKVYRHCLESADVIICCLPKCKNKGEYYLNSHHLSYLKKGAIILDICGDTDRCLNPVLQHEASKEKLAQVGGVHIGFFSNLSSRVARTASMSISNHILPILFLLSENNVSEHHFMERIDMHTGVYIYHGRIVHRKVSTYFDMQWRDLNLFLALRQ